MTTPTRSRREVERYVDRQINKLQSGLLQQNSTYARALLAQLRRGVGSAPGELETTWDIEYGELPESLRGSGDEPATVGEWAVHLALTLYATHQQSQQRAMHRRTDFDKHELYGFGSSVRRLTSRNRSTGQGEQLSAGEMPRRFKAMVTSESIEEFAHYARQLVTQLRSEEIPIDYASFAGQIYDYQSPYRRNGVRLEWAREFAQTPEEESAQQEADSAGNN